jgi:hypothetical protein
MYELKIKHKYKIGDVVYFMYRDKTAKGVVSSIEIVLEAGRIKHGSISEKIAKGLISLLPNQYKFRSKIVYTLDKVSNENTYQGTPFIYEESKVYKTKDDLLRNI